ncbi:MAG: Ig-like domain-containing protein, partial [Pseudomonadota bacterium]
DIDNDNFDGVIITTLSNDGVLTLNGFDVIVGQTVSATDIANDLLVFTPDADENGFPYTNFTFQVQDDSASNNTDLSANNMTIEVAPVSDAPEGADNTITIQEDNAHTLTATDFGFSDLDGDDFDGITIAPLPTDGSLTLDGVDVVAMQSISAASIANGDLVFTPDLNDNGSAYTSFTFQVQDDSASDNIDLSPNTLTFDVTPVNDDPIANTDSALVDQLTSDNMIDVLTNDTDIDSTPPFTVTGVTNGSNGTVDLIGGEVFYSPTGRFSGNDSFTYTISDNNGGTATGTVNVEVNPIVVKLFDSMGVLKDTFATIQEGVDAGVDGDSITVEPGPYDEIVTIDKSISISGTGTLNTEVQVAGVVIDPAALDGAADAISVSNLTLDPTLQSAGTIGVRFAGDFNGTQEGTLTFDGVTNATDVGGAGFDQSAMLINGGGADFNLQILNSSFSGNGANPNSGGSGEITLFEFLGDATITNVSLTGNTGAVPNTSADNGLQISGFEDVAGTGMETTTDPAGTINISGLTIEGTYGKTLASIQGYNDLGGLSFASTTLGSASSATGWTALFINQPLSMNTLPADGTNNVDLTGVSFNGGAYPNFGIAPGDGGAWINAYVGNDSITATSGDDIVVDLLGGDDTIILGAGDDGVASGIGNDEITGGLGNDSIDAGDGTADVA